MIYVLNSPVLTSYGDWHFEGPATPLQGRELLLGGFTSAIGHEGAAVFLSALLGITIPTNRIRIEMQPGDQALVVRILDRMPEGKIFSEQEMQGLAYELGILRRIA